MATSSIPHSSGIYKITCTANGKIYVGSSNDLMRRWWQHRRALSLNNHRNKHLQNAWNKYGETVFSFEIVELVMPWALIDREQYWLDKLRPFGEAGFNIAEDAENPARGRKLSIEHRANVSVALMGHVVSVETRAKISAAHKGKKSSPDAIEKRAARLRGRKLSPAHIQKISAIHKGKKLKPEQVHQMAEVNSRDYIVTSPDGIEIRVRNLSRFCRDNNLSNKALSNVAYGLSTHHKGWKCRRVNEE